MKSPRLGLIDYGSGNLRSVSKAASKIGAEVEILSTPHRIEAMDGLILPGVGAFGDCAEQLHQRQLWEPLAEWLQADRPFLGICLGYQLLFEESEETPGVRGFGRFGGTVRRFRTPGLKVPQIGWNSLDFKKPTASLWTGLNNGSYVYFVHSFYPVPTDQTIISATASYGADFAAAVEEGNLMGVQFHPEKSQDVGLAMLRNFASLVANKQAGGALT